jgi:hypothetical protein
MKIISNEKGKRNKRERWERKVTSALTSGALSKLCKRHVLLDACARPFWPANRWWRGPGGWYDDR